MVKQSTIIFTVLAMLTFGACTCWGYTVTQWPPAGIPNTVYGPGAAALGSAGPGAMMPGYGTPGTAGPGWYGNPGAYGGYGGYGGGNYGQGGWPR